MSLNERLVNVQPGLGCSLFILKVQRQNVVIYLGAFDSVPHHVLRITKKREMFVLSLLYRVSLM